MLGVDELLAGGDTKVELRHGNSEGESIGRGALALPSEGSHADPLLSRRSLRLGGEEGRGESSVGRSSFGDEGLLPAEGGGGRRGPRRRPEGKRRGAPRRRQERRRQRQATRTAPAIEEQRQERREQRSLSAAGGGSKGEGGEGGEGGAGGRSAMEAAPAAAAGERKREASLIPC